MTSSRCLILIAFLIPAGVTGCQNSAAKNNTAGEHHIPAETLSRSMQSVVQIQDRQTGGVGTGFLYWKYPDKTYAVMTCSHVITAGRFGGPDLSSLYAVHSPFTDSSVTTFDLVIHDPVRDVAILRTKPIQTDLPFFNPMKRPQVNRPRHTSPPLFVVGFPHGVRTVLTTTPVQRDWRKLAAQPVWYLDDTAIPGSSGGPVVTYDGAVVGMIQGWHRQSNHGICLSLAGIHPFLQEVSNGKHPTHYASSN